MSWLIRYDSCHSSELFLLRSWLSIASYQALGEMHEEVQS